MLMRQRVANRIIGFENRTFKIVINTPCRFLIGVVISVFV